uniref:DUF148 domain-containing protein n=1 Tax=Strongyloides venezuelensis TaxID=75913 RepID=A0A0K0FWE0_STRVS
MRVGFILYFLTFYVTIGFCDISELFGSDVQKKIDEIIPQEARKFYNDLTAKDRNIFSEIIGKLNQFNSSGDILQALEGRSSILYQKAEGIINWYKEAYGGLSGKAKDFVTEVVETGKRIISGGLNLQNIKLEMNKLIVVYRQLPDFVKGELDNTFPKIAAILHNDILNTMARSLLGIGNTDFYYQGPVDNPIDTDDVIRPTADDITHPTDNTNDDRFRKNLDINTTLQPDNSHHKVPGDDIEEVVQKKDIDLRRYNRV